MKLWNDDQQAQSTLAMAQVNTARQRQFNEACSQGSQRRTRSAAPGLAGVEKGFVSSSRDESARTEAQANAPASASRRAPTSSSSRPRLRRPASAGANESLRAAPDGTVAKIVGEIGGILDAVAAQAR